MIYEHHEKQHDTICLSGGVQMKNHLTILIGNGFNHFANSYLNSTGNRDSIINTLQEVNQKSKRRPMSDDGSVINETINGIAKALDEYCHLLDDIAIDDSSHSGEYFLEELFKFTHSFDITNLNDDIETAIKKKIKFVITDRNYLRDSEGKSILVNVTLRTLFSVRQDYFSNILYDTLKHLSDGSIDVVTTNYDYICESVFCEVGSKEPKDRSHKNINYMQLHGNYDNGIVCTAPRHKVNKIDCQQFQQFQDTISRSNTIILFGIGLWSDPHILATLNEKKNCNFVIIDSDIENYMSTNYPIHDYANENLPFSFLKNNSIYYIDTTKPMLLDSSVIHPHTTPESIIKGLEYISSKIIRHRFR